MKKVLSLILAAAFVFALATSFVGCNLKPKTPSEKFREARDNVCSEARIGPLDKNYKIDDVNYADLTIDVEAPNFLGEEKITLTVKGGIDADLGHVTAELGATYKSSDLKAKVDVADKKTAYLSFPGMSETFLYTELSELAEKADDAADSVINGKVSIDSLLEGDGNVMKLLRDTCDELFAKYVVDEAITVETEDVEVLGETVKGAEKLSISFDKEQLADIFAKFKDVLKDYTDYEIDDLADEAIATVTFWVAGGKTVRAEATAAGPKDDASVIYQMKSAQGEVKIEADFTLKEDGTVKTLIPFRYEHKEDNGKYEGKCGLDADKLVAPEDSDFDIDADSLSVEFEGTASGNSADMTYTLKIGAGGTTLRIPVNVKISKSGFNADNIEVTIDSQLIGVKLTAKGVVSHDTIRVSPPTDLSKGVKYSDDMSDEDNAKVEALVNELSGKLGDFKDLAQSILNMFIANMGGGMGLSLGDDDDDYDDWDDDYDDDDRDDDDYVDFDTIYLWGDGVFYTIGSGFSSCTEQLTTSVKDGVVSFEADGETVEIDFNKEPSSVTIGKEKFNVEYYDSGDEREALFTPEVIDSLVTSESYSVYYDKVSDEARGMHNFYFESEVDGDNVTMHLPDKDVTFVCGDSGESVVIDGMEFEID